MKEVVLDASVVAKWFRDRDEDHVDQARRLRSAYEEGELAVFAPPLLGLELLNVVGRRWHLQARRLTEFAELLVALDFEWTEPELTAVAHWTAQGLTAYDSTYVALAEQLSTPLITADEQVASVAGILAQRLADVE